MQEKERELFQRDGVVVLRGAFGDWIDTLREGIEVNEAEPGPWFRNYTPDRKDGRFFGDYCNWKRIGPFRRFVEQGPSAAIAKSLMNSKCARIFHEHVLVKEAGADKVSPWHHDEPYYCVSAAQTVSIWIPLDPVPRATCLEFVAGSHQWGKLFRPRRFTGVAYDHKSDRLQELPDIEANRADYPILGWDLELGDAIAFDFRTVHGAPAIHQRRDPVVWFHFVGSATMRFIWIAAGKPPRLILILPLC